MILYPKVTWHSSKLCLFSSRNWILLSRSKFISLTCKKVNLISYNWGKIQREIQLFPPLFVWFTKTSKVLLNVPRMILSLTWSCKDLISSSVNNNAFEVWRSALSEVCAVSTALRALSNCVMKQKEMRGLKTSTVEYCKIFRFERI